MQKLSLDPLKRISKKFRVSPYSSQRQVKLVAVRDSLSTAACCDPGWIASSTLLGSEPYFYFYSTFSFVNGKPISCSKLGARAICNTQSQVLLIRTIKGQFTIDYYENYILKPCIKPANMHSKASRGGTAHHRLGHCINLRNK